MEELEKSLSPALAFLETIGQQAWGSAANALSIPQAVALSVTLLLAVACHAWVKRVISSFGERFDGVVWRRVIRTARSISLPIAWLVGLWIALLVLNGFGEQTALIRLFASLLNAWVVIRIASTLIPSATVSNVFAWVAWTIAALNAVGLLDPFIAWMDGIRLDNSSISISMWGIVQGLIITGLLLWFAYALSGFVQSRLEKSASLNPSMRVLTSKLLRILFVALAIVFGMQSVGVDLTAFAVFSGALGLGVGLGMQRTVGNLVSGFTMLADRSIKPGDVIEIETGEGPTRGEVKTLGARYVSVKTRAGTETLIPNELLISSPVTNWTFSDKRVRRGIAIGVSYDTDVEMAQALCIEAALNVGRVLKSPKPVCLVRGFGDSSVDLDLRFWIADPEDGIANISSDVFLQVWKLFKANNIEIPFPQRDLHFRSGLTEALSASHS